MTDESLDVLDLASVAEIIKCEGGTLVIGKVWELVKNDDGGDSWVSKTRLHIATSEAAVAKLVKDYLRMNVRNENGMLNEPDE